MLSRLSVVTCCLSLAALCAAGSAAALQLPLPPPGEDIVGQVQVIKAKYEDTFADLGTAYDLGYSEMVAANPGVDAWLPGAGTEIVLPTRFILPPGPREGIVINLAEYRLYYYPKGQNVVYTFPLGIGREGWGSPIAHTSIIAKTPNPTWTPPASIKAEHAANGEQAQGRVVQTRAGAIQEHYGFAALAAHRQQRQQQQAPAALACQALVGVAYQAVAKGGAAAMHPEHHLHHQSAGDQGQQRLQPFAFGAGHGFCGPQHQPGQARRAQQTEQHPGPQKACQARAAGLLADPGLQDADHQQRFDAFAPHNEHRLIHQRLRRLLSEEAAFGQLWVELVEERVFAGFERVDHHKGGDAGR